MRGRKKELKPLPIGPLKKGDDKNVLKALGETVKRLRKCAHISQERIGKLVALQQAAVCRAEMGLQGLQPWQLLKISELYDVNVNEILTGEINYWLVAERFGRTPPFPKRYLELIFGKVREFLPLLQFMVQQKGQAFTNRVLGELELDSNYLRGPDQPIGVHCNLDLMREAVKRGVLSDQTLTALVSETRTHSVQGFLHQLYQTQNSPMNLIKTHLLNAHHYESNFIYTIEDELNPTSIVVSVKPADHMKFLPYKDAELGDVLCRYRREYLSQFPVYIGGKPINVSEKECHFHGAGRCVYTIDVAKAKAVDTEVEQLQQAA